MFLDQRFFCLPEPENAGRPGRIPFEVFEGLVIEQPVDVALQADGDKPSEIKADRTEKEQYDEHGEGERCFRVLNDDAESVQERERRESPEFLELCDCINNDGERGNAAQDTEPRTGY